MKLLNIKSKGKTENEVTDFEKLYINPPEKVNPVIRVGSIVLYTTVIIAVLACAFMAVLDKTGVAPSHESQPNKKVEITEPIDVSGHPESLQKLYRENFETADFVASYFKLKDKKKEVSLKAYKKTTGVPLFLQWDKQWGYLQYGDDFAGVNADGPMCVAMVGYYLTKDEKFSPDKMISFAADNGFYISGKGTHYKLITEGITDSRVYRLHRQVKISLLLFSRDILLSVTWVPVSLHRRLIMLLSVLTARVICLSMTRTAL